MERKKDPHPHHPCVDETLEVKVEFLFHGKGY
jgi:hypothetical protein